MANKYAQFSRDPQELIDWKRRRKGKVLRSCLRKQKYRTESFAKEMAARVTETNRKKVWPPARYYYCKYCGNYHVTKRPLNGANLILQFTNSPKLGKWAGTAIEMHSLDVVMDFLQENICVYTKSDIDKMDTKVMNESMQKDGFVKSNKIVIWKDAKTFCKEQEVKTIKKFNFIHALKPEEFFSGEEYQEYLIDKSIRAEEQEKKRHEKAVASLKKKIADRNSDNI